MPAVETQKIEKLIRRVQALLKLAEHQERFAVPHCIDRYYYIRKMKELELLTEAFLNQRISKEQITQQYNELYFQWSKDARWLNKHILFNTPCLKVYSYTSF